MSFEAVSDQLRILKESNAQLKDLIDRLANINFQPGSVPLEDSDENVATELSSEIHQTIKDQDEDFELLLEEVHDLDAGRDNSELAHQKEDMMNNVTRAIAELKIYQTEFRRAQITAKRKLEAAQKAERELLLQSYLEPPRTGNSSPAPGFLPPRRKPQNAALTEEEKTINAASDVTRALRKTHEMMASELARSQFANETLTQSTAALAQLSETYSTLDTLLTNSRNLLGTLLRSQKSDTWYLETAFYILATTIVWLLFRRLAYGPLYLVYWLVSTPLRMWIKGMMGVLSALGILGGAATESAVGMSMSEGVQQQSVVHMSGTRGPKPSLGPPGSHHINVGGGGRGAPMRGPNTPGHKGEESVSDQVGRIIDESQQESSMQDAGSEGEAVPEEEAESKGNPMKRMWEEEKEALKVAARNKDEL